MQSTRQRIIKLYRQLKSSSSSTSMRRSETWATSFQRPNDLTQNATRPRNEASAGNGSGSISATGSSNIRALQRSLSEIFGPNKVIIDAHEEVSHHTREVSIDQTPPSVSIRRASLPQVLTPSNPDAFNATPVAVQPCQHHPKAMLRRQWSLVAVPESDPAHEVQPSSVHPNDDDRRSKARASPSALRISTSVDENQNTVGPVARDEMAAGETTSSDHVMQVPQTAFGGPSRRFGIMNLLGAGEKKKVRNKDVNMFAPQSW